VTPRRTRQNIVTPNMPPQNTLTDIYEFTDEDEKVGQKYSKSPEPPVISVVPNNSSSPPTGALVISTSPLTRKSRRLQVNFIINLMSVISVLLLILIYLCIFVFRKKMEVKVL